MKNIFDAVKEKSPILFIGAGFSRCLGLPDWKNLVLNIIDLCEKNDPVKTAYKTLIENGREDLLEMIDKYEKEKRTIYSEIIKKQLKIDENHPNLDRYKKLWNITSRIITTNYDKALDITKENNIPNLNNNAEFELARIHEEPSYLLKLHGTTDNAESCILFTSDYKKLYNGETLVKSVFENIIKNNTLIFLGFSMTDPYVNEIFENINTVYKNYLDNHFIITTSNTDDFSKFNIINHKISNWGDGLDNFLDELIKSKDKTEPSLAPTVEIKTEDITISNYVAPVNKLDKYPRLTNLFTGREREQELFRSAIKNHRIFAIEGLGGFGKTEFAAKCIEDFIENKENVVWLNGNEESKFDLFVESIGYGELLKSEVKTQQAIFSGLLMLIERDKKIIFLDNFQAIKSDVFNKFLEYAQPLLKDATIIIISKKEVYTNGTSLHVIPIKGLENALEYAQKIRDSEEKYKNITDDDLQLLVENTLEHPLAIKLSIPLLNKGIKVNELIEKIVIYKGQGLQEIEELTKRIFDEVYHHESTSEGEKMLIQKISIFRNIITKEAIDFLFGADQFVNLSKLIDKFLITKDGDNFKLHPLIRELSYNLLENKIDAHSKIVEFYKTKREDKLEIDTEENILYHLAKSEQWEEVNKEIDERGRDLILKGQYELINEFIEKLQNVKIENPLFNIFLGEVEIINGNYDKAIEFYENATNQIINKEVAAEADLKLGEIYYYKGDIERSKTKFNEVLIISKELNYLKLQADVLNNLGGVYEHQGKYEQAIQSYLNSLNMNQEMNNQQGIADSFTCLGNIYRDQGEYEKAIQYYMNSLKINQEIGHRQGIAASLGNLGSLYQRFGKYELAIQSHINSLNIKKEIGHRQGISVSLSNLGLIYEEQNKYDESEKYHLESLKINQEIGYQQGIAASLGNLGGLYQKFRKHELAIEYFVDSLKIEQAIGHRQGIAASLGNLGTFYQQLKKYPQAIENIENGLKIFEEIGHKREIGISYHNLGAIYSEKDNLNSHLALTYFFKAIIIFKKIGLKATSALSWANDLRDKILKKDKFRLVANEVFNNLDEDDKQYINIREICREPMQLTLPSRNSPCHCGSGKQYKRCHGK